METLFVENVGPIKSAQIEIKKYTVFIGPQGAGKSILAKLIAMLTSGKEGVNEFPMMDHYGMRELIKEDSIIRYQPSQAIQSGSKSFSPLSFFPSERNVVPVLRKIGIIQELAASVLPSPVICFDKLFGSLNEMERNVSIPFLKQPREWALEGGTGYDAAAPMIRITEKLRQQQPNRFIIEEPETGLWPSTQKDLVYALVGGLSAKSEYQDTDLIMTTHSPYVLSSLNTLIVAQRMATRYPKAVADVEEIIPKRHWIDGKHIAAYYVDKGTVRSIINSKTGLIADNELDDVSEDLTGEQDKLFSISSKKSPV